MKPVRPLLCRQGSAYIFMSFKAIKHKRYWWFRRENTAPLGTFYCWNSNLYIYNLCIDKNTFPQVFKEAKVIPLFKSGDKSDPSNFRPISILPILSKPLKNTHINEHVMKHFLVNDLFYQKQSGFRPNHSCHTALTELIDTWLSEININKLCGALFIDFKLTLCGLSANTLSLICSFLNSRLQKVSLKDNQSDFKTVLYGVPQGSVLGPLLFSIYINDLPLHVPSAKCDMLADDTTIHTSGQDLPALSNNCSPVMSLWCCWMDTS